MGQIATGTSVKTCCFRDSKIQVTDSALEEIVTEQLNKKMSILQRSETSGFISLL